MPAKPIVGKLAKVTFGASPTTILNEKWSLTLPGNLAEAPNTTDGMLRCEGIDDATASIEGSMDTTAAANMPGVQFAKGMTGVVKLYINATQFYSFNAIIGNVSVDSAGVNAPIKYTLEVALQSGTITYPV